jgi:hypothetical protein
MTDEEFIEFLKEMERRYQDPLPVLYGRAEGRDPGDRAFLPLGMRDETGDPLFPDGEIPRSIVRNEKLDAMAKELHVRETSPSDGSGTANVDKEFTLALKRLREFQDTQGGEELMGELENWQQLDGSQKRVLIERITVFCEEGKRIRKAMAFLKHVGRSFPENAGCATAILLLALLCSPYLWLEAVRSWGWGIALAVVALLVSFITSIVVGTKRVKAWVLHHMIPEGEAQGIDFEDIVKLLFSYGSGDDDTPADIKKYISDRETIAGVLLDEGKVRVPE